MMTEQEIQDYLKNAIASFDNDPPNTPFQHGYLAALYTVLEDCFMTSEERAVYRKAIKHSN